VVSISIRIESEGDFNDYLDATTVAWQGTLTSTINTGTKDFILIRIVMIVVFFSSTNNSCEFTWKSTAKYVCISSKINDLSFYR